MTSPTTDARNTGTEGRRTAIIDTDVHVFPRDDSEIAERMDQPWRDRYQTIRRPFYWPVPPITGSRIDSTPPGGGPPGSDPEFLRHQLIDEYGIDYAILLPRSFATMHPDYDYATAIAKGFNDWLADTWLSEYNADGVFKGSINVAHQDPTAAAAEIDRMASHPHMVQVMMDSGSRSPYGHRQFWPIYEACERNGLPLAIHPGTDGVGPNEHFTIGPAIRFIEWHTLMSLSFQSHLVSFITEGVFERFPNFKLVLVEGGVTWLPPLMWRLDDQYKSGRAEVPWMTRRPFEYVRDNVRFSSQPMEMPDDAAHLLQLFDMFEAENILMFSSDYPHYDFDSPTRTFPKLPEATKRRIFFDTAAELYGLSERSPAG
jgi:predicted TIM-barrel fold metal-dependent hydrolase